MTKNQSKQNQSQRNSKLHEWIKSTKPVLRFSPTAWAKLLYFRDKGNTEISGFGITELNDLLYVKEFMTIKQDVTIASISLDDEAVSTFFETQVDLGRRPEQFFRIWCHSHPGESPTPSSKDEETFHRVFGRCEWALMFVVAQDGKTYARLRFNVGPGGHLIIPVQVDYARPFGPSEQDNWEAEYQTNIKTATRPGGRVKDQEAVRESDLADFAFSGEILEQFEDMEPAERQYVLEELEARPDIWGDVSEEFAW